MKLNVHREGEQNPRSRIWSAAACEEHPLADAFFPRGCKKFLQCSQCRTGWRQSRQHMYLAGPAEPTWHAFWIIAEKIPTGLTEPGHLPTFI